MKNKNVILLLPKHQMTEKDIYDKYLKEIRGRRIF
jgi:hypothetical protein